MPSMFEYDRLTPSRAREIAEAIRADPEAAQAFADKTVERLAKIIPDDGVVRAERLEEAFLIAVETRKIFSAAKLDIWKFFEKPRARSLLGHVFISAVDGRSLREIIGDAQRQSGTSEFRFDAATFKEKQKPTSRHKIPAA